MPWLNVKCGVPFQMVVLESAPDKALAATVDKWLEWDLGETRQEVTREKSSLVYHLLAVSLVCYHHHHGHFSQE